MRHLNPRCSARFPDLPAINIDWFMAARYCNLLSKAERNADEQFCYETDAKGRVTNLKANYLSLKGYRLPTEAEMEYATRATAVTSRYYGETNELLGKYAWYFENASELLQRVGAKKPNDFGFFDLLGNCSNWCQERFEDYPVVKSAQIIEDNVDRIVTVDGAKDRVARGGFFLYPPSILRSGCRFTQSPANRFNSYGFRPARTFAP